MSRLHTIFIAVIAVSICALAAPAGAFAQASRTWVSGVGDDANPCSRTAPCKTFAGAISKTAVSGEINCIDPGGFGAVTITKSIRISCAHVQGSVLASLTNGIVINGAGINVLIDGLDINGNANGYDGIKVINARSVKVTRTTIFNFANNGIKFEPTAANARLHVVDSLIQQNTLNGILGAPTAAGTGRIIVEDTHLMDNGCGFTITDRLAGGTDPFIRCGTQEAADGGAISAMIVRTTIDESKNRGVYVNGLGSIRLGGSAVTGAANGIGWTNTSGGAGVFSYGDNYLSANAAGNSFTGSISPI